jgi:hypothetical protein
MRREDKGVQDVDRTYPNKLDILYRLLVFVGD